MNKNQQNIKKQLLFEHTYNKKNRSLQEIEQTGRINPNQFEFLKHKQNKYLVQILGKNKVHLIEQKYQHLMDYR